MPVNPWLAEKLKGLRSPPTIEVIAELADPALLEKLRAVPGAIVGKGAFNMVRLTVPPELVAQIGALPGVTVHYNAPVGIRSPLRFPGFPVLPDPPSILDPLMGEFKLSSIVIPYSPKQMAASFGPRLGVGIATLPFRMANQFFGIRSPLGAIQEPGVIIQPTGEVLAVLELPEDNVVRNVKVAILDTGLTPLHPQLDPRTKGFLTLGTFAGPVPFDGLGHGQFVATEAFGGEAWTRFGLCKGVADVRNGNIGSWKVMNDLGFGETFAIVQGIEAAVKWGAHIINLSLGGELQGSVEDDPLCRVIKALKDRVIVVCAAGNDGPGEYTIGTPAASPYALTVGGWSTYYKGVPFFSSRGPNAAYYRDRGGALSEGMTKPDCIAPSGGPVNDGDPMDLLYSGMTGWAEGAYDLSPLDLFGALRGTSQAAPLAAGVVALAMEKGYVRTAADVKAKLARHGRKDHVRGYGLITYKKLV